MAPVRLYVWDLIFNDMQNVEKKLKGHIKTIIFAAYFFIKSL